MRKERPPRHVISHTSVGAAPTWTSPEPAVLLSHSHHIRNAVSDDRPTDTSHVCKHRLAEMPSEKVVRQLNRIYWITAHGVGGPVIGTK